MSRRKHKKEVTNNQEPEMTPETEIKEEKEMTNEKVNIFVKFGRGIKRGVTSCFGKTAVIIGVVAVGVTAAGVIIYKRFFSDGTEDITTSEGDLDCLDNETMSEVNEELTSLEEVTTEE